MSCFSPQDPCEHQTDAALHEETYHDNVISMRDTVAAKTRAIDVLVDANCRMQHLSAADTRHIVVDAKRAYRSGAASPAMAIAHARRQARRAALHGSQT